MSGGEDLKYRVWDSFGRQLYQSAPYDHVITSVKWSPNGDLFAVGSYEMIRLCDKSGWSYSFAKHTCGSLIKLSWCNDGTVVSGGGGNGAVLFGYLVDKQLTWANIEAVLDEDNKITVTDCLHEINEELDFRERVVQMSLRHNHLIVAMATQCYIYNVMNWTSPFVIDIKETVNLIIQGARYLALVDAAGGFNIYNYEGRILSSPKY